MIHTFSLKIALFKLFSRLHSNASVCESIGNITELLVPFNYYVNDLACADAAPSDLRTDEIKAISSVRDNIEYVECFTDRAFEAPECYEPDSILAQSQR